MTFEDVILAFFSFFEALGIKTDYAIYDSCPDWPLNRVTVSAMIKSICFNACPGHPFLCRELTTKQKTINYCDPTGDDSILKAGMLSFEKNILQKESLRNILIFRYLFFLIYN